MWVTLYSDASIRGNISGYGIWLRSEKGRIVDQGRCDGWVTDVNAAEIFAVYKAVVAVVEQWPETKGIQVNTDNQVVMTALWPWSPEHNHPQIRKAQDLTRDLLQKHEIRVRTKHVKGHQRGDNTRSWLNNRCDNLAGRVTGKIGSNKYVIKSSAEGRGGTTASSFRGDPAESIIRPRVNPVCEELRLSPLPPKLPSPRTGAGAEIQAFCGEPRGAARETID